VPRDFSSFESPPHNPTRISASSPRCILTSPHRHERGRPSSCEDILSSTKVPGRRRISTIQTPAFKQPLLDTARCTNARNKEELQLLGILAQRSTEIVSMLTDSLLVPKPSGAGHGLKHESSHWDSAPLAFSLLPGRGGMTFTNGSSVIADILHCWAQLLFS
jgi:hypothetical protein